MKFFFIFSFLIFSACISHAVTISSKTYNYIWNPFTGTQQYVTSIDTDSITASGIVVSTTSGGVLLTSTGTTMIPCGNSGDVQINFNGTCGGIGGGTTGSVSGGIASIGVNNGILTSITGGASNLFVSTFNATSLDGFKIYASSGAIPSNSDVTITIPGTTQIWLPMVTELETVNTSVISIRIKSISSNSYVVYNADAINAKAYITWVFAR